MGFICWLLKANIVADWAVTATESDLDPAYFAPKLLARGLTTAFLIFLFIKLDTLTIPQENRHVLSYHFQVSAMTLMILATFLECLIDQYQHTDGLVSVDSRLRFV